MSPRLTALATAAAVTAVAVAGSVGAGPAGAAARELSAEQTAAGIVANDADLRAAIDAWRADEDPLSAEPPAEVMEASRYLQKTIRTLVRKRSLARNVRDRLPTRLAGQVQSLIVAQRDLVKLSDGWPPHEVETGKPEPLASLSSYYDEAHDRHGIGRHYLAAINLVESKFGRVKNDSVAGAQGPMQFIPSTWEIYGDGGNIQDPHDAILAAANLLRDNGAPADYPRALRAYNNSSLYVDAVTRYARQIKRDPYALYFLYCFGP